MSPESEPRAGSPADLLPPDSHAAIGLRWLIRLRWGAAAAQVAVIAAAQATQGNLPLGRLSILVAALAASNALLSLFRGHLARPSLWCGAALALDMLLLTGLLGLTGGASNPFSVVYLVHITLAAVMLGSRWTRGLAALAITCYAVLFLGDSSATAPHSETDLRNHLQGMWVAFAAAAILVAYFVAKLSAELERRDADVTEMRLRVARQQRLASVTTLAAGAAHELGTPLATIAVASVELERAIRNLPPALAGTLREDTELIRAEVGRCREILARLASNAGQSPGETPALVSIRELAAQLALALPPERRARLRLEGLEADLRHTATREALTQVARNLLENAFEAGDGDVCLRFESSGPRLRMIVRDDGRGMTPEELSRAGEPFFSTKQPGAGLGLGLFIARSLTEQMGGRLRIASRPGAGTTVTVDLDGTAAEAGGHRDA